MSARVIIGLAIGVVLFGSDRHDLPAPAPKPATVEPAPEREPEPRPKRARRKRRTKRRVSVGPLPNVSLPRPSRGGAVFDEGDLHRAVSTRKRTLTPCFRRMRRGAAKKITFDLTIASSGRVSDVVLRPPAFGSSTLGRCVIRKARRWRFAAFAGRAQRVSMPLVIAAGN